MIEVLETGIVNQTLVYVTNDERTLLRRLFWLKGQAATYFDEKRRKYARHWLLKDSTLKKLGLMSQRQSLRPE